MPRPSVVFEAFSDNGETIGNSFATAAGAVVRALIMRGVAAKCEITGEPGIDWIRSQNLPFADPGDVEGAQVNLRGFPGGTWPPRPEGPRYVVDLAFSPSSSSGEADHYICFTTDPGVTPPFPPSKLTVDSDLYPVAPEVFLVKKALMPKQVVVHLGLDHLNRLAGIVGAIHGYGDMTSKGIRFSTQGVTSPGPPPIVQTATPWEEMSTADIAVTGPGFGNRLAAALRVPTLIVASNPLEEQWMAGIVQEGAPHFDYIGSLSTLSDNQIRAACDGLVNGETGSLDGLKNADTRRRVMRLAAEVILGHGSSAGRIADWVARMLVGQGAGDPFAVKGYDTIRRDQPVV
jgi:hypothetical protein